MARDSAVNVVMCACEQNSRTRLECYIGQVSRGSMQGGRRPWRLTNARVGIPQFPTNAEAQSSRIDQHERGRERSGSVREREGAEHRQSRA